MSGKNSRVSVGPKSGIEEGENGPKPLAATLLQEFQNLREKLKNEDENGDRGYFTIYLRLLNFVF